MKKMVPIDPDNLNNERADWAEAALDAFALVTRMDTAGEDYETILGDLLCDLMHWCDRNGVDFDVMLDVARMGYEDETTEKDKR